MARRGRALAAALITVGLLGAGRAAAGSVPAPPPGGRGYAGDFDGDGRADVYWPGRGAAPERFAFGEAGGGFAVEDVPLSGTYTTLVGDFDGDGCTDLLLYGPGRARDVLWYGGRDRGMTQVAVDVRGTYRPAVGDFDGDRRDDVLWAGTHSVLWSGGASRAFGGRTLTTPAGATPYAGDVDADGHDDVVWQAHSGSHNPLWYGAARGAFTRRTRPRLAGSRVVLADVDGDGTADALSYVPGTARAALDLGSRARLDRRTVPELGALRDVTAGDFDGNGADDLLLTGTGATARLRYAEPGGAFLTGPESHRATGTPAVADYDGDGRADAAWPDRRTVWRGSPLRGVGIAAAATRQNRVAALDPAVWRTRYNPYGYVAHALGDAGGVSYTNSLEAFRSSYEEGFRVFEVDLVLLRDGTVFAAHDGTEEKFFGLRRRFREMPYSALRGKKILGRYTALTGGALLGLLRQHRDAYLVLDTKGQRDASEHVVLTRWMLTHANDPQVARRLLPHVADQTELDAIRRYYPLQHYVLALYRTQAHDRLDDAAVRAFVSRNDVPAVMMWFRERDPSKSLSQNGRERRRYTAEFAQALQDRGAVVYVHSLRDTEQINAFAWAGVGVYSDGPFARLVAGPAHGTPTAR